VGRPAGCRSAGIVPDRSRVGLALVGLALVGLALAGWNARRHETDERHRKSYALHRYLTNKKRRCAEFRHADVTHQNAEAEL
jgi:hypothetical protein